MFKKAKKKLVRIYGEDNSESESDSDWFEILYEVIINVYYVTLYSVSSACSFNINDEFRAKL